MLDLVYLCKVGFRVIYFYLNKLFIRKYNYNICYITEHI